MQDISYNDKIHTQSTIIYKKINILISILVCIAIYVIVFFIDKEKVFILNLVFITYPIWIISPFLDGCVIKEDKIVKYRYFKKRIYKYQDFQYAFITFNLTGRSHCFLGKSIKNGFKPYLTVTFSNEVKEYYIKDLEKSNSVFYQVHAKDASSKPVICYCCFTGDGVEESLIKHFNGIYYIPLSVMSRYHDIINNYIGVYHIDYNRVRIIDDKIIKFNKQGGYR